VIERILDSTKGRELFKKYLEMEYSIENYSCWEDMTKFKNEGDLIKRQELAQYCYTIYFNGKASPLEVNCPSSIGKSVLEGVHEAPANLFDEAMKTIMLNMSDSFMRLRYTPEFIILNAKEKWMDEPVVSRAVVEVPTIETPREHPKDCKEALVTHTRELTHEPSEGRNSSAGHELQPNEVNVSLNHSLNEPG
jgi:hypothetical protein